MSDAFLALLRDQPFYSGQILRVEDFHGQGAQTSSCGEFLKDLAGFASTGCDTELLKRIFRASGLTSLYRHQAAALRRLLQRSDAPTSGMGLPHTLLATGEGSGRSTVADIAACYRVLAFSENVLILCPNAVQARRRYEGCRRTIGTLDFDYAIAVSLLGDPPSAKESRGLPEIVVATPPQLARVFESNSRDELAPAFFACLKFIVAEDIHEYSGIYGANVAALFRCMKVLLSHRNNTPLLMATAPPFANIQAFAEELMECTLQQGGCIAEDTAGSTRKTLVFWNAPLESRGEQYERKDLRQDLRDLVKFLSPSIADTLPGARRFVFLVDKSISMTSSNTYRQVLEAIRGDFITLSRESGFQSGDRIDFYRFDTRLEGPIAQVEYNGGRFVVPGRDETLSAEDIFTGLGQYGESGGTSLAVALRDCLGQLLSGLDREPFSRLVVFIYSDGECEVSLQEANTIRGQVESLSIGKRVPLDLYYISLDIEPDPSIRRLVEGFGGKVFPNMRAADLSSPVGVWRRDSEAERPILVLCQNDLLSVQDVSDLNIRNSMRRILLYPRVSHPGLEHVFPLSEEFVASSDLFSRCQYVLVVGWNGSPCLLRHYLDHAGKSDAYVFMVGTLDALTKVTVAQWHTQSEGKPKDRLSLNPHISNVGMRALRYFSHYEPLSVGEACAIVYGRGRDENGQARQRESFLSELASTRGLTLVADSMVLPDTRDQSGGECAWEQFHIAYHPLYLRTTGDGHRAAVDQTSLLRRLVRGGSLLINGGLYTVNALEPEASLIPGSDRKYRFPKYDLKLIPLEDLTSALSLPTIGNPTLVRKRVQVTARVNGAREFAGARYDLPANEVSFAPVELDFETEAAAISFESGESVDSALLCSFENIVWVFLNAFVCGEDHGCICVACPEMKTLYLLDTVPQGGGLARLLDNGDALRDAVELAMLALMECPCEPQKNGGDPGSGDGPGPHMRPPDSDNEGGCVFCLRAPTKPVGLVEETGNKRAILEFLCGANQAWEKQWHRWLKEKYDSIDDDTCFSGDRGKFELSLVDLVTVILRDSLGIEIPGNVRAGCRFATEHEAEERPGAAGWYDPNLNEVVVKKGFKKFALMSILAHEYTHNWQHVAWDEGASRVLRQYDDENVESPDNVPFLGRLFIEGSAEWAAAAAMDYFAPRHVLSRRDIRGGDEYAIGFSLFNKMAQQHGRKGVIDFLTRLVIPGDTGCWDALCRQLGVQSAILAAGQTTMDGLLALLRRLNNENDVLRISASLAVSIRAGEVPLMDKVTVQKRQSDGSSRTELDLDQLRLLVPYVLLGKALDAFPELAKVLEDDLGMGALLTCPGAAKITLWTACHLYSGIGGAKTSEKLHPIEDFFIRIYRENLGCA